MHLDFTGVPDTSDFTTVPTGTYVCRVTEVRPGTARDGSERWRFRLDVHGGQHAGKVAAWDSVTFSERGMPRAKHVLGALGFDTTTPLELEPEHLEGHEAEVQIELEEWEDPVTGKRQVRNNVPYLGYASTVEGVAEASGTDVPF